LAPPAPAGYGGNRSAAVRLLDSGAVWLWLWLGEGHPNGCFMGALRWRNRACSLQAAEYFLADRATSTSVGWQVWCQPL